MKRDALYSSLFDNAPVMMHSIDRAGRLVAVNKAWLEKLGYQRDEIIGRKSMFFLTEESRAYAESRALPKFFEAGNSTDVAYTFVKKNGEPLDVLLSAVSVKNPKGGFAHSVAMLVDVSASPVAAQQLGFTGRSGQVSEGRISHPSVPHIIARFETLVNREVQVLELLVGGMSNKQMAAELNLSPKTVEVYRGRLNKKMHARSFAELVRMAIVIGMGRFQ